jgi:aspartate/methionine/tyrosine aminotransferase
VNPSQRSPFTSRFHWEEHPNALTKLLQEKRNAGVEILDLTESNPTRAGLEYPEQQILQALADPAALHYDPTPNGLYTAREAVSQYYAGLGADVSPSRILLTASTSEAYAYLFKLLTSPGDEVLVPRPSYPLFEYLAAMESVKVRQYPLRYDGAWHIDFAPSSWSIRTIPRAPT